jgi:hypothetical protein
MRPWLVARHVHEFCNEACSDASWHAPLTLLAGIASELSGEGPVVWIGRRCWPTFQAIRREKEDARSGARHLFLDPLSDAERLWGLLEAARCPAVRVVVADGGGMDRTAGRRLQLAAEKGNAVVLLARPPSDFAEPSWATTRWRVWPRPSLDVPRWNVAMVRAAGTGIGQDASRQWVCSWTYEVFRGSGALGLSAAVGRGTGTAAAPAGSTRRQTA